MATFQAEIGRKRMRKGEIKITVPFRSYPTCDRKFQKKQQKNLKNSKISMWLHYKPKQVLKSREREKIKIIVSFRFVSIGCVIENSIRMAKKLKKLKNAIMATFQAKIGLKNRRKFENKNYGFIPFLPDAYLNIPEKQQKNSKNWKIPLWLHFNTKQVGKV